MWYVFVVVELSVLILLLLVIEIAPVPVEVWEGEWWRGCGGGRRHRCPGQLPVRIAPPSESGRREAQRGHTAGSGRYLHTMEGEYLHVAPFSLIRASWVSVCKDNITKSASLLVTAVLFSFY